MPGTTIPRPADHADGRHAAPEDAGRRAHRWPALVGFVALAQLGGLVGVPLTDTGPGSWYDGLDKPPFTPPGWVFAPVWTTLYVVVGVAGWLVWRHRPSPARSVALAAWGVQLALNALWTPVFFGLERPGWALVEISLLWVAAAAALVLGRRVDRAAAVLFVPYLGWVSFAVVLTAAIAARG